MNFRANLDLFDWFNFKCELCFLWFIREAVEAVNTEGAVAVTEDEKKQEDLPQSEPEKNKEGEPNEEEEKEPEDKAHHCFNYLLMRTKSGGSAPAN